MITAEQFLKNTGKDELFSVIESFLYRWREQLKKDYPNKPITETFYKFAPVDNEKFKIIKNILTDYENE